ACVRLNLAMVPQPVPPPFQPSEQLPADTQLPELILYSHSSLFYWWPVWSMGFLFAFLTWLQGEKVTIGGQEYLMHPSKNLGVIYTVIFTLVILMTNVTLRGLVSVIAI